MFIPLLGELVIDVTELRDSRQRAITISRLLLDGWGLPVLDTGELRTEAEAAGFEVLRTLPEPSNPLALTGGLRLAPTPELEPRSQDDKGLGGPCGQSEMVTG